MSIGSLSRWVAACGAVLLTAPAGLACENPDDITYALRSAAPAVVEPDEFVLEVDIASRADVEDRPTVQRIGDLELAFDSTFAVFDVKRVHAGHFAEQQVRIPFVMNSCSAFSAAENAAYLVGRWSTASDGARKFMVLPISRRELRAEREASQQDAN